MMEYDESKILPKFLNSSNSFETFKAKSTKSSQRYEILKNFKRIQKIIQGSYKYIEQKENVIQRKSSVDPMYDKRYSLEMLKVEDPEYKQHLVNIHRMGTILKKLSS
mmetsp:Transcript_1862/g.1658  ORF Transcript_1862/g.1658 Transcript_1862/m.1658 type:complete len:107 (+) Transcript_1862:505-825(+)